MAFYPSDRKQEIRALRSRIETEPGFYPLRHCPRGPEILEEARDQKKYPYDVCLHGGRCDHQKSCRDIGNQASPEVKLFLRINGNGKN
ncbi:MAG TPA: hypothetical protein PLK35_03480 [Candidatus Moranbacteria bacterium]|nr:hypothetical protein [Candidatus Moranbacteria bacterium]